MTFMQNTTRTHQFSWSEFIHIRLERLSLRHCVKDVASGRVDLSLFGLLNAMLGACANSMTCKLYKETSLEKRQYNRLTGCVAKFIRLLCVGRFLGG